MNPATQLVSQFVKNLDSDGRVLSVSGESVKVSTPNGIIETTLKINSDVKVGDSVKVSNGQIIGRKKRESSLPIYYL